jgi:SAM-dependent methyltransferase
VRPGKMIDLEQYRETDQERSRAADLIRILPRGGSSVLDLGARDGHFSKILTQFFSKVTALDLETPSFEHPGVIKVAGDITHLEFPDNSFECVFCTEVLEHIPKLQQACDEIRRVAKHDIVIGVPYRQDIRVGRTTCSSCGKINPPWGHVNSFDEGRLARLFSGMRVISVSYVGTTQATTNRLSTFLMDLAGNPWGTYDQEEPCIHCGAKLSWGGSRSMLQKVCSALAARINWAQGLWTKPRAAWIHIVFRKDEKGI